MTASEVAMTASEVALLIGERACQVLRDELSRREMLVDAVLATVDVSYSVYVNEQTDASTIARNVLTEIEERAAQRPLGVTHVDCIETRRVMAPPPPEQYESIDIVVSYAL